MELVRSSAGRGKGDMTVTRMFGAPLHRRASADPGFAEALLREGLEMMLAGDVDTGKAILRDYIKATVGFERLGERPTPRRKVSSACSAREATRRPEISFGVIAYLQRRRSEDAWYAFSRRQIQAARRG